MSSAALWESQAAVEGNAAPLTGSAPAQVDRAAGTASFPPAHLAAQHAEHLGDDAAVVSSLGTQPPELSHSRARTPGEGLGAVRTAAQLLGRGEPACL